MIIAFTGKRNVGKTTAANYLVQKHDFVRAHPFNPGKAMCKAYYQYCGATEDEAERMINGDLKDPPSVYLPGNSTSRFLMEEWGMFSGKVLGPAWTLGVELKKIQRDQPDKNIVIESLVYEEPWVRVHFPNTIVVRLLRPETEDLNIGYTKNTDAAEKEIVVNYVLKNKGSVGHLYEKIETMLDWINKSKFA